MNRRVVVTGLGAITPIGNNVPEFWSAVKQQKVGIGEITHFDATDYKCHLAAEVKDFDAKEYMDFRSAKRMEAFPPVCRSGSQRGTGGFRTFHGSERMHTVWVLPSVPESEVYRQSKESIANYWKRDREE